MLMIRVPWSSSQPQQTRNVGHERHGWRCTRSLAASARWTVAERDDPPEEVRPDGEIVRRCIYTPHSLRATTATLLLDANVDIIKVKDLLGHRHVTTTQIYDKRRRSTAESASHLLAI
jgi:integrase